MRRIRLTGRFYLILLILLAAIAFVLLRDRLPFMSRVSVVAAADASYTQQVNAVIIRDEDTFSSESTARVEYVAMEGAWVDEGDTIAYLYSAGYTENELKKLETIRANIQAYHKSILANIVDTQLNRLDAAVDALAEDFKSLVNHVTHGNLNSLSRQLEAMMVARQDYMRQNKREDLKLNKLYEEESTRLNSIASWRSEATASESGVVSFYVDGYEDDLTADALVSLDTETVRAVLAGQPLTTTKSRSQAIYRIVNQDRWYAAIITDARNWNPVVGQHYYLQAEGFEDLTYNAYVSRVIKTGNEVLAEFQVNDPIGPLIYKRSGTFYLSTELTGLSVSSRAVVEQNGQSGVWVNDVPGGTFIAVNVLSNDGRTALVQPLVDGTLQVGQVVLIK